VTCTAKGWERIDLAASASRPQTDAANKHITGALSTSDAGRDPGDKADGDSEQAS
jgi:hypothetical protein